MVLRSAGVRRGDRARAGDAVSAETMDRIAAVMGCAPADDDDLVEAVRLLVAERDAARAEADALRAENTRLATSNAHAADLIVERNHYRERAETHRGRIDWMQSVAAAAMRQGLAECRRLRAELEWARTAVGVTEVQLAGARAIVEGRTVAPTDAEIAAHLAAGGDWLVRKTLDATLIPRTVRWHPLDATGCPTTWPVTP